MRLFIVGAALLLTSTAAAQSRWTLSTGPEWTPHGTPMWGARFRAEYDLTRPNSVFGVRLETGARWSPTQTYFFPAGPVFSASWSTQQRLDLMLGLNASLSPIPRARVSPYVSMGVFGRQQWTHGSYYIAGETSPTTSSLSTTRGDIVTTLGVGLRLRLGGHAFQLELRGVQTELGLTLGTRIPF